MRAKTANTGIQVDFSLEKGKSWSNVIKYLFGDSYFHERFNNDTALAAVRGTVFEVNLDHKYLHTVDHGVSVQDTKDATGELMVVTDGVMSTDTHQMMTKADIDTTWNRLNHDADIIYLNGKMESLKKEIMEQAGKTNRMETFMQKVGLKKPSAPLEMLMTSDKSEWTQFEQSMKKGGDTTQLMDIYQRLYGLPNDDTLIDTKMRLRDLIIETAPTDKKKGFLDDFARSSLYDSWSTETMGTGSIQGLQEKLQNYIKQGADRTLINELEDTAKQERIQKLNGVLENAKQGIIQTIGEKNLLEEAKKEVTTENLKKMNDTATEVRESIMDKFKNLIR